MKKTAKEWFEELPSPIKDMAVENAKKICLLMIIFVETMLYITRDED